jgi:hypothetical protein
MAKVLEHASPSGIALSDYIGHNFLPIIFSK